MHDEDLAVDPALDENEETELESGEDFSAEEQAKERLKEALVVEKEEIGPLRMKLLVTLPEEYLFERRNEQYQEMRRDALIPGFRKGHAPMKLVERRFASDVSEQLKTQLIGGGYMAAIEKADLDPIGDPLFRVRVKSERTPEGGRPADAEVEKLLPIDKALDHVAIPKDGPLQFVCEVELKPVFDLPSLDKIGVERRRFEITEAIIDDEIRNLLAGKGTYKPVEDGTVATDDLLYGRVRMQVEGRDVVTDDSLELAARDQRVFGVPLAGLSDAVVGRKVGETLTLEAVVPDDHDNLDVRGKTAQFSIELLEVKRLENAELDEKFLASVGCESEQELRDLVRQSMATTLEEMNLRSMRGQVAKYLVENTSMQIPDGISQRQTDRLVARRMVEMLQSNTPPAEITRAMDELRMTARQKVVHDFKLMFILERIAGERSIDVSESEVNAAIARIARRTNSRFDRVRDELAAGDGLLALALSIRDDKVLDSLLEDAEINEVEGPKTEAVAD
jgi:trigger factor